MAKILFPTDFSPAAENAFVYALHVAGRIGAEIVTLNVYEQPRIPGLERFPRTAEEIYESLRLEGFDEYKTAVKKLHVIAEEAGMSNVPLRHEYKSGEIVDMINRIALEEDVAMIVMGTKGATGFREVFLGSKTADVLARAKRPVLAIPDEAKFEGINKIVITTEFKPEDPSLIKSTLEFAKLFDAQVLLLHIDTKYDNPSVAQELMKKTVEEFKDDPNFYFDIIPNMNREGSMVEFASEHGVDVMVLMSKHRNFFQRLFHYSISRRMAYHSQIPLLVIPEEDL